MEDPVAQRTRHPYPFHHNRAMERVLLQHPAIPEARRMAAEAVRAHLVHHRGGAPFLSPSDTLILVDWLDREVPVVAMLAAIERCAVARRRSGARTRFTLGSAKRHLFKPPLVRVDLEAGDHEHPYRPLLDALDDPADPVAESLHKHLSTMADDPVEAAVTVCASVLEEAWNALSTPDREAHLQAAAEELGDLSAVLDTNTFRELAEEVARGRFRERWPRLDTTTFVHLVAS